ncbi:TldD/PmbA family protein [Treponema pedis]|nr:TldD/PmbA family protein [Treponema pedis]QOW59691.1 TldD/PmbA family protein [Treponema pedis]
MVYSSKSLLEAAQNAVPKAELVTLRIHRKKNSSFLAHDAEFENAGYFYDAGFMVEVLYKGHIAYAASQNLTPQGAAEAAQKAFNAADSGSSFKIADFDLSIRPDSVLKNETLCGKKTYPSKAEIFDWLFELCNTLKISDEIIDTDSYAFLNEHTIELLTSSGANIFQNFNTVLSGFEAAARRGDVIQRRSWNGGARLFQGGCEFLNFSASKKEAERVGNEAIELLSCKTCPSDRRTLVLMPDQMILQIHESVGHPLEIDRIIGDERNYAGGSFIKPEDIGKFQYGSKLMNICFDPSIPYQIASYGADQTGTQAKKMFIIKEGILQCALGGVESAYRLYKKTPKFAECTVANQRAASWNRPPIDRMANLNLEPGSSSFDKIISSIEKGIIMSSNRSWSIDDYRNKFQFGCEYAKLIENGKITETVRDPNYRGVSQTFWRNLCAVGDKSTFEVFGTPSCGKGEPNQEIAVGHASPVCAFSDVEVFGGGK